MKIFFRRPFLRVFIILMVIVAGSSSFAQKKALNPPSEAKRWEKVLIQGNINISEWFDSAAEGLDLFLVGKKITNKQNESQIRIENTTTSSEGQAVINSWGISINPKLPNLEEYWNLKFTTYDEREDRRNTKNAYLRQTPRQQNYGATVGLFRKLGNVRTSFQPRIELQDPLKISHSLIFDSVADQKTFEINPKLEFYANPDRGVGTFQALNFHFILSKLWSLTLINQGDYEEKTHLYLVTNGFSFGHELSPRSAFAYNFIFTSSNQPNYHLVSYNLSMAYSEVLYKRVLDFQLIPNLDFNEIVNFKGNLGLTLNFNFHF